MLLEATLGQIFLSEFMGTAMLILLGAGVCASNGFNKSKAKGAGWLTVNFGWGLAVFSGVLVAFQTGGHLNPAVTIGVAVSKAGTADPCFVGSGPECAVPITAATISIYILAQLIGAIFGAVLCYLAFFKQYNIEQPEGSKLGSFATGPEIAAAPWNVVSEAMGTFVLVFVVLISGYQGNSGDLGWLNALGVAFLIIAIGNSLGGPTGYAINPARDLGPRIAYALLPMKGGKGSANWGYAWVPVLGPILGGVVAGLAILGVHAAFPMA
ncbi:MAG: aquaporin family protein [Propionibacteriaceae bacterium]|nr:aquaporin family protein [Propionibacteriaceae bacterium]